MDLIARYLAVVIAGVCFAFGPTWLHVCCLVLFIACVPVAKSHRILLCVAYYAVAVSPLLAAAFDYSDSAPLAVFGYSVTVIINATLVSSALIVQNRYRGVAVAGAIVLLSIPPLSVVSIVSPLPVAGTLFPGTGVIGLLLFLVVIALCCTRIKPIIIAAVALMLSLSQSHAALPISTSTMVGLDTHRGAPSQTETAVFSQLHRNEERILARDAHADMVVFPESTFGVWHKSYADILKLASVSIVGGARHYLTEATYVNVLINGATGEIIYAQQYPIPLSLKGRARAVSGRALPTNNAFNVLICNEITNVWHTYNTFASAKHHVVIWIANFGWTHNAAVINRTIANTIHWSRLFGVPVVKAVNHHA